MCLILLKTWQQYQIRLNNCKQMMVNSFIIYTILSWQELDMPGKNGTYIAEEKQRPRKNMAALSQPHTREGNCSSVSPWCLRKLSYPCLLLLQHKDVEKTWYLFEFLYSIWFYAFYVNEFGKYCWWLVFMSYII